MYHEQNLALAVGTHRNYDIYRDNPCTRTPKRACGLVHLIWGVVTLCAGVLAARLFHFRNARKENMSAFIIKKTCEHCGGSVEFDGNELKPNENRLIPCPHCKNEMLLSRPSEKKQFLSPIMKWVVIGWTLFCIFGLGGCVVLDAVIAGSPTNGHKTDPTVSGLAFMGTGFFSFLFWAFAWFVIAIPCTVIWLVSRKKD
jgi:hypothetical protein